MRTRTLAPPALASLGNITINPISPECVGPDLLPYDTGFASATWTANLLIFVPLITPETITISQFFWRNGSAVNGNTDVGIYTFDGQTKLGSTGSTANAGTSAIQVVNVADFRIPAFKRLWLALGCDSSTQTFWAANASIRALEITAVKQQAAGWSSGLPATVTFAAPSVASLPLFGFTGSSVI